MGRYVKKSNIQEFKQIRKISDAPDNVAVKENEDSKEPLKTLKVYDGSKQKWNAFQPGDMIRFDKAPKECYPVDKKTFDQYYEPLTESL